MIFSCKRPSHPYRTANPLSSGPQNMVENAGSKTLAMEFAVLMISHRLVPIVQSIANHGTYRQVDRAQNQAHGSVCPDLFFFNSLTFVLPLRSDEELKEDAETLAEKLADTFDHMSTYDEYVAEVSLLIKRHPVCTTIAVYCLDTLALPLPFPPQVRSGKLSWSPVHRSERFWRENAEKLNDKKHEILKLLLAYLKKSDDATVRIW